jgi:hypothetical protein
MVWQSARNANTLILRDLTDLYILFPYPAVKLTQILRSLPSESNTMYMGKVMRNGRKIAQSGVYRVFWDTLPYKSPNVLLETQYPIPPIKRKLDNKNISVSQECQVMITDHLIPCEYGVGLCWPWGTRIWSPICQAGRLDCPIEILHTQSNLKT